VSRQKLLEAVKTGISLPECWPEYIPEARACDRETSVP